MGNSEEYACAACGGEARLYIHPMSQPQPECPVCKSLRFRVDLPVVLPVTLEVLSFPQGVKDIDVHVMGHLGMPTMKAVDAAPGETLVTCVDCGHELPLWVLRQEEDPAQAASGWVAVEITDFQM